MKDGDVLILKFVPRLFGLINKSHLVSDTLTDFFGKFQLGLIRNFFGLMDLLKMLPLSDNCPVIAAFALCYFSHSMDRNGEIFS